jgi:hypothetical protein
MNKRTLVLAVAVLLSTLSVAAAPAAKDALTVPMSGTFIDALGSTGRFQGTFQITDFSATPAQLFANGYLSGTLTDSLGNPIGSVMKSVSVPATVTGGSSSARDGKMAISSNATCDILNLVLGPLHLDLLGLTVDLNQVVLDIAAQTGAGNLLGNLLCAVTNLLNGAGSLVDIAVLLNRILEILTGVLG